MRLTEKEKAEIYKKAVESANDHVKNVLALDIALHFIETRRLKSCCAIEAESALTEINKALK